MLSLAPFHFNYKFSVQHFVHQWPPIIKQLYDNCTRQVFSYVRIGGNYKKPISKFAVLGGVKGLNIEQELKIPISSK